MNESGSEIPAPLAEPDLHPLKRAGAGLLAAWLTWWGGRLFLALAIGTFSGREFDPIGLCLDLGAIVLAALFWDYALLGNQPASRRRRKCARWGGLVCGGLGFAGGFFGPIIFAPEANQGPLLGIFITGPAGFVLGVVGGWIYAVVRR